MRRRMSERHQRRKRHVREPRRTRRERGAAAVETALCLTFIVIPLIFGVIEFGMMLTYRQALSQAASEGARSTVGAPTASVTSTAQTAISQSLTSYAQTCGTGGLTCTISAPTTANCAANHTCVTVTVKSTYRGNSKFISFPGLGFALPSTLSFTSSVEVS